MSITIHVLRPGDEAMLGDVAPDVFDDEVNPLWAAEFAADPRHHMVVALDGARVVGMASGVHYLHPDKPNELFVNEVGVAPTHHRRGIARRLLDALFAEGRAAGCSQAWVATDVSNAKARALYSSTGGQESPEPFIMYTFDLNA
jgi:aminoglycoside 6'-N-acetyltransferase I